MKWFEYRTLTNDDAEDLNDLGKDGWELVSVVYREWENDRKGYSQSETTYYFKKERHSYYQPRVGDPV